MKSLVVFLFCLIIVKYSSSQKPIPHIYQIIVANDTAPGRINYEIIENLSEPMKAVLAFYTFMGASCDGDLCHISRAMGFSDSTRKKESGLIKKYFPNDSAARLMVRGGYYLGGEGSSAFTDYSYLTITDFGNKVRVAYNLICWRRGLAPSIKGPDVYLFKNNIFITVKRHLFKWTDKK